MTTQEGAKQRLADEIDRVNALIERNANRRPTFADCAARYITDSKTKRSVNAIAWHIRLLIPYVGSLDIHQVHGATLESFVADRLASGVTATTINRSLEVVRTILTRAARSYREHAGEVQGAAAVKRFQFRDLRAKAGTDKADATDMREAQQQLGHKSVKTTEIYLRARAGEKVTPTK